MNVHHATNGFHDANRGRELSREARTLAKLLRLHVAQVLTRHNLRVPTALASELTSSQTAAEKEAANNLLSSGAHEEAAASTITFEKLRTSFDRLVSRFNNKYRSDVQRFVAQIEITLASIELNVVGIVQEIFSDDVVTWGRVVALAGFITSIALECSRAELLQVIEPLIEHTASISEERVTPFVRENGGWPGFVFFFNADYDDEGEEEVGSVRRANSEDSSNETERPSLSKLVTYAATASAIGVGMLAAFLARK